MFNPADAKIVFQQTESFVGIRRNVLTKDIEFCLPIGFGNFPVEDTSAVVKLYFDLYRAFNIFASVNQDKLRIDNTSAKTDGVVNKDGRGNDKPSWTGNGLQYWDEDGEIVTLYNKIPAVESLLHKYSDLHIEAILLRDRKTEFVRYEKVHNYLDKAIYLEDDAPFIDTMLLPCQAVTYSVTDLVRLYCFLLSELKRAMGEVASLSHGVLFQAGVFKEKWLNPDSGLFSKSHEFTVRLLKDTLHEIHRNVSLQGTDYWEIYEVIESFLYAGSSANADGIFCGITRFSLVWEDMCIAWAIHSQTNDIVFADTNRLSNANGIGSKYVDRERFNNPFFITHFDDRKDSRKQSRFLFPDIVLLTDVAERKKKDFYKIFRISDNEISCNMRLATELLDGEASPKNITGLKTKSVYSLLQRLVYRLNGNNSSYLPQQSAREYKPTKGIDRSVIDRFIEELKFKNINDGGDSATIVDCKYVGASTYGVGKLIEYSKGWEDFAKQITYVLCLQITKKYGQVTSEFWVPKFVNSSETKRPVPDEELDTRMFERKLKVCELSFGNVLDVYLMANKV